MAAGCVAVIELQADTKRLVLKVTSPGGKPMQILISPSADSASYM